MQSKVDCIEAESFDKTCPVSTVLALIQFINGYDTFFFKAYIHADYIIRLVLVFSVDKNKKYCS